MNKQELIDELSARSGQTKAAVGRVLDSLAETVTHHLRQGGEINLTGIGKFSKADRAARIGRNPQTGVAAEIPASVAAKFKASQTLKNALNA